MFEECYSILGLEIKPKAAYRKGFLVDEEKLISQ